MLNPAVSLVNLDSSWWQVFLFERIINGLELNMTQHALTYWEILEICQVNILKFAITTWTNLDTEAILLPLIRGIIIIETGLDQPIYIYIASCNCWGALIWICFSCNCVAAPLRNETWPAWRVSFSDRVMKDLMIHLQDRTGRLQEKNAYMKCI